MTAYQMGGIAISWSDLTLCKGDPIANVRMDCSNAKRMADYFEMLKAVMVKHNFLNNPSQIYNVDETGIPLDHRQPKVIAKRG